MFKGIRKRKPLLLIFIIILAIYGLRELLGARRPVVESPPGPWYRIYFTSPSYPDEEAYHFGGIDERLTAAIEEAESSIEIAAYDFDLEGVAEALIKAKERGVAVRFVTDTDNVDEEAIQKLKGAGIQVVDDGRGGIMHNKFVVIDSQTVWTGSWNLTENGTYRNNNSVIVISSPALAHNYTTEFEEMFERKEFGPASPSDTPYPLITIAGTKVENYFAPEDDVAEKIIAQLEEAEDSIFFLAFAFTDEKIAEAMMAKAKEGVLVQGVFEKRGAESKYSRYSLMRKKGLDVCADGNPYLMHHKVIIVDEETVILGSFNFTRSADELNDENILIIHDRGVAALYLEEFWRIYKQGVGALLRQPQAGCSHQIVMYCVTI